MKQTSKIILLAVAIVWLTAGCTKVDLDKAGDVNYGASLAVPVGSVHISMEDILNMAKISQISTDEDYSINLFWKDTTKVLKVDLGDYTKGQRVNGEISITNSVPEIAAIISVLPEGAAINVPAGTYEFEKDLKYAFGFNAVNENEERIIREVDIDKANIDIDLLTEGITMNNDNYLEVEISFPNIQQNGTPKTFKLKMTSSNGSIADTMKHFSIGFPDTDTANEVSMHYRCKLVSDGAMTITKHAKLGYETYFNLMDTRQALGRFWMKNPIYSNKFSVDIPKAITDAEIFKSSNLYVHNPQLLIDITNNIGVDIALNLNEISAIGKDGQTRYAMFDGSKKKSISLTRPTVPQDTASDIVMFDRENGGIQELFKSIPTKINVDCNVMAGKKNSLYEDFIVNPTVVKLNMQCKLPLWFDPGTELTYSDTIKADFSNMSGEWSDIVNIEQFNVYMNVANGFPFDFQADISFADENGNILYTRENDIFKAAHTDENGLSIESTLEEHILTFENDDVTKIFKTKMIIIKAKISSDDHQMNIKATDKLDVKISAYAKMKANIVSFFK